MKIVVNNVKRCPKCKTLKPASEWHRNAGRSDGMAVWCKTCMGAYQREWRARPEVKERQAKLAADRYAAMSDEERAEYIRNSIETKRNNAPYLKKNYGITLEQYNQILEGQGGGCAICGKKPLPNRRHPVDHDHSCCAGEKTCGRCIRGILCITCNVWLGFYENKPWVARAQHYLDNSGDYEDDDTTSYQASHPHEWPPVERWLEKWSA